MTSLLATSDGIWTGNGDFADVMFLVAFILFIIGAVVAWAIQPRALWATVVSVGLACMALAWMVL
jgi:hypothetical protein